MLHLVEIRELKKVNGAEGRVNGGPALLL